MRSSEGVLVRLGSLRTCRQIGASGGLPVDYGFWAAEIKVLKAKVRRLEEDNAILKAARVFFAGELDPRNR